jgi:hypothetical protein
MEPEIIAIVHLGKVIDKERNLVIYNWWEDYSETDEFYYLNAVNDENEIIVANVSDCLVIDEFNKHQYPEYLI